MSRYIDADALVKRLKHSPLFLGTNMQFKDGVVDLVEKQPTADVVEVRHGEWEGQEFDDGFGFKYKNYWCSVCGRKLVGYSDAKEAPYCHCGAKMDGERSAE